MHVVLLPLLLLVAPERTTMTWDVAGLERQAIVVAPSAHEGDPAPVVFVFHGHGGRAERVSRSFHIESLWPEAIVVYPQGVPTPSRLVDPLGRRSGWQSREGQQDDRDLKFFDAMLATLHEKFNVDDDRVYATGHSNGGTMTFLLWEVRPDVLAAVAPSASAAGPGRRLKSKPAMQIASEADPIVKYSWQEATMDFIRKLNHCEPDGTAWAENATLYPSPTGTPFVAVIHPDGHKFYDKAPALIVRFFKEHARDESKANK